MTTDERPFDERFADRVRDAFDAYDEPVDEAALARLQAALGQGGSHGRRPAADRGPVAPARSMRWRVAAAALVLLALGTSVWRLQTHPVETAGLADAPSPPATTSERPERAEVASAFESDAAAEPARPAIAEARMPTATGAQPPNAQPTALLAPPASGAGGDGGGGPAVVDGAPNARPVSPAGPDGPSPAAEPPTDVAALPPTPSVFGTGGRDLGGLPPPPTQSGVTPAEPEAPTVRLVVATASAFSDDQTVEGAGIAAGVVREWRVAPGVAVSGGAVAAYGRYTIEPAVTADGALFADLEANPGRAVRVPAQSTLTTVAVEVPLDLAVDVAQAPGGRLGASVGLTSALYLVQEARDEGRAYTLTVEEGTSTSEGSLGSVAYEARETVGPLGRLDLGRQLNLGVGYTADRGRLPLSVDVYARLPLGGLTSRDLPLTTVGVRLRYALW